MNRPLLALFSSLALGACASTDTAKDPAKPDAVSMGIQIVGDTSIEQYDLNGDGKADLKKTYVFRGPKDDPEKRKQLIAQQELDLDFDGKFDVVRHYDESGKVVSEELDLDFDGKKDAIDYYDNGVLVRRDMAMNFDGKPTIRKFYSDDKLTRREVDSNNDGKLDTFEFYENGKLVRIGVDKDGDEKPDVYQEVEAETKN